MFTHHEIYILGAKIISLHVLLRVGSPSSLVVD